jgi:superfamily I DNA/RNA helicase
MADPLDGDLIVVGDGNQGVYRNREFTWADVGIQAVGRTINAKFDLDKCYRSTREIITLAQSFTSAGQNQADVAIAAMPIDPKQCTRTSILRPILLRCANQEEECRYAAAVTLELMTGKWFGRDLPAPLQPSEIGILYRKASGDQAKGLLSQLENQIGKAVWLSRDRATLQRVGDPLVKIQTIHSAKGLQFKAVILLWAGQMPSTGEADDPAVERRLMYVSLTRAEDYLTVLHSTVSPYVTELIASGAAEVVSAGS